MKLARPSGQPLPLFEGKTGANGCLDLEVEIPELGEGKARGHGAAM